MAQVDYERLKIIGDLNERSRILNDTIRTCPLDDPIFLSDAIVRIKNGELEAQELFIALEQNEKARHPNVPMLWKIQVMVDEFGNKPNPGDIVRKINKKPLKNPDGTPLDVGALNTAIALGTYSEKFEEIVEYKIDAKGCIECSFTDAVHYLSLYGIHAMTGVPLTTKPVHSREPVDTIPGDPHSPKLHVWYRRFKEMNKDMCKKLPKISKQIEPKRGE